MFIKIGAALINVQCIQKIYESCGDVKVQFSNGDDMIVRNFKTKEELENHILNEIENKTFVKKLGRCCA